MLHETFEVKVDYEKLGIKHDDVMPTCTTYILDSYPEYQGIRKRPLIVICPGGGYEHHSPREGEAIAVKMNNYGFNAVVVRYSLTPNEYPCALYELASVVAMARDKADEWSIDPDKIIVAGFSAGGHLAASLGNMWNKGFISEALSVPAEKIKPNGMLLSYPVITSGEFAHMGSFENLLGSQYEKLLEELSLEKSVTKDTPKAFIWHTFEDGTVPVENSILLANALREKEIPFELHIFPCGSHGLGLATQETNTIEGNKFQPECAVWTDMFATWVGNLK